MKACGVCGTLTTERWRCKPCVLAYHKAKRAANKEALSAYNRQYYLNNREELLQFKRDRYRAMKG